VYKKVSQRFFDYNFKKLLTSFHQNWHTALAINP